ncbi:MAG: N-acetylmuramoyl-L-alanine amidase [Armatimonadota bacterium]|nr:MAG: N-acetylmuramoyl-L-alanine amidase [Armatimonadota bacterium]
MSAVVAAVALCLAVAVDELWADTMVVAGHRVESPAEFVVAGDDVFAPLLPSLRHLGAWYEFTPDAIMITTRNERQIVISRRRGEGTRDGVVRELAGPPQGEGERTLLPARGVGALLGCGVRWDEETRTLFFYPWVRKFSLQTLRDRYRLTIGAEGPITYQTGELRNPRRLFVDLLNADLAQIPSELKLVDSYLTGARIHQHSVEPEPEGEVTRVVVDLTEWRPYRIRESEDGCTLEIEFPLPEASELPLDVEPVVLREVGFERISSRLAAVKVAAVGTPFCVSEKIEDPPVVIVDVANATNEIDSPELKVTDPAVAGVCLMPAPEKPGTQRIAVALKELVGHAVVTEEGEVRVLVGRFPLSELKVVVDAGHGGHDTGAIGRSGLEEKEINLDIARRVYRLLQGMGVKVRMTRVDDNPVRPWTRGNRKEQREELLARCKIADEMDADLFVSIHANARATNPTEYRGTETYYRKEDSAALARAMQKEVVGAVGLPDGGVIRHPKPIIVLHGTKMPSVLVEVGYLSHEADEAELATPELRERAAQGVVNGVRRYVEEGGLLPKLARRESEKRRPAYERWW